MVMISSWYEKKNFKSPFLLFDIAPPFGDSIYQYDTEMEVFIDHERLNVYQVSLEFADRLKRMSW